MVLVLMHVLTMTGFILAKYRKKIDITFLFNGTCFNACAYHDWVYFGKVQKAQQERRHNVFLFYKMALALGF